MLSCRKRIVLLQGNDHYPGILAAVNNQGFKKLPVTLSRYSLIFFLKSDKVVVNLLFIFYVHEGGQSLGYQANVLLTNEPTFR